MPEITIIEDMSQLEAEACLEAIQGNIDEAARLTNDFDIRRGWKALNYASLKDCLQNELRYDRTYVWRLEVAAGVVGSIQDALPAGTRVVAREGTIRNSGIKSLPTGSARAEAYINAEKIAAAEGTRMTANHLKKAVEQVKTKSDVFKSNYQIITHMVVSGDITANVGKEIDTIIEKLAPRKRGYMVELMARYKLSCPALFAPIAEMFDRPAGKESLVLPEVLTGFLAGTPLATATVTDLRKASHAAQQQHLADLEEKKRLSAKTPEPVYVSMTLPIGNWNKTEKILRRELGEVGFEWLHRMMLGV